MKIRINCTVYCPWSGTLNSVFRLHLLWVLIIFSNVTWWWLNDRVFVYYWPIGRHALMLYFLLEWETSTTWQSNWKHKIWKLMSRHCTILKCCNITILRCMVQPPLQDHPTWGTCPVPQVQGLASCRCSNLHGHRFFSSQQHRWRVLSHQGLHFRLISDSNCPLMQSQGNLMMQLVCHYYHSVSLLWNLSENYVNFWQIIIIK